MQTETTDKSPKVIAAAVAFATKLCDMCDAAHVKHAATPAQVARGKRYQIEEFSRRSTRTERVVCELIHDEASGRLDVSSREELLALMDLYCAAGIAEVERRFAGKVAA